MKRGKLKLPEKEGGTKRTEEEFRSHRKKKQKETKKEKSGKLRWYPKSLHILRISGSRPIFVLFFRLGLSPPFIIWSLFFVSHLLYPSPLTPESRSVSSCCKIQSPHLGRTVASCGSCRNTQTSESHRPTFSASIGALPDSFMTHSWSWSGCVG